jgi:phage-related minor tail protein
MAETGSSSAADDALDRADDLAGRVEALKLRTDALTSSANTFSSAMARAFTQATVGGKQLDDVFRSLVLRMSNLAVAQAFKPISTGISSGINSLIGNLTSGFSGVAANARGAVKPFAAGGVIGTPTYFPMSDGGLGLAGEAGPEAIVPLARGPDGRLGIAAQGGSGQTVIVQISTPDADSFRRSESYVTGQIARAVARGQRTM